MAPSEPAQRLADLVRKIDTGALPTADPLKTWAGYGGGRPCSVCDEPILPAQIEYECEDAKTARTFRFHVDCFGLWEAHRRRRGLATAPKREDDEGRPRADSAG